MEMVVIGKYNKKVEAMIGRTRYTEVDAKVLRVASMLCFELFNESVENSVVKFAAVLTQSEAKHSYEVIIAVLDELLPHINNLKVKEGDNASQKEKFQFKAKVIKELVVFLENVRNLIENAVSYFLDDKKVTIYQNEDFRKKTKLITDAIDDQWDYLTSGFSSNNETIRKLNDLNREVKRMINVPLKLNLDKHNKVKDIKIEETRRDPRQFGKN
jgi:hypothetical protein